jgi:hypothetical protein
MIEARAINRFLFGVLFPSAPREASLFFRPPTPTEQNNKCDQAGPQAILSVVLIYYAAQADRTET